MDLVCCLIFNACEANLNIHQRPIKRTSAPEISVILLRFIALSFEMFKQWLVTKWSFVFIIATPRSHDFWHNRDIYKQVLSFEHGRCGVRIERQQLGWVVENAGIFRRDCWNDRKTWNVWNTAAVFVDVLVGQVSNYIHFTLRSISYTMHHCIVAYFLFSLWAHIKRHSLLP